MKLVGLNKKWIWIIIAFVLVRIIVFSSFWEASADKGGWNNFYAWSQPAQAALMQKFHEPCDWRPPLYYTFTSTALFLFKSQLSIYLFQLLLAFASLIIGYKIIVKEVVILLLIFNVLFLVVLAPWIIRNKIIYDRFSFANLSATNVYYYNLPPLIAFQKNISYQEASDIIIAKAEKDLGPAHVAAKEWNCGLFTNKELNKQFDYYSSESNKYILRNLKDYLQLHLVKMAPFFADSGYFDMYSAYTGEYSKPDITAAFLKRDFKEIKKFFTGLDFKKTIYIFGIFFWLIVFASLVAAVFYSFFKDKSKFLFFAFSLLLAFYTSFLTSPFNFARYRLPLYLFFFAAFVYVVEKIITLWKNKRE